jgi:hypothetical protein
MNRWLKLSNKIEGWFVQIKQTLPPVAWYAILFISILGNVFLSGYLGPAVNSLFSFFWCVSLFVVIIDIPDSPQKKDDSYMGLFFGTFLFLVFVFLLGRCILYYL